MSGYEDQTWKNVLINENSSIQDAIINLDETGLRIVLVVNNNNTLCGTVTDGDIRRALLKGADIKQKISSVMFQSPLVVNNEIGQSAILQLMHSNKIYQIPVIDDERKVIGLHLLDSVTMPTTRENNIIIMAGGFGKRLRPFTEDCPKPMLPIAGKPILEHIIERAKTEGFVNFIITLHYLGHIIKNHFGDGSRWGVNIRYVNEEIPLGTGGALSLIEPIPAQPFIITNGDVLTGIRYSEILDFHSSHDAAATMAVFKYELQHPFGVVRTSGLKITGFDEKPIHRSYVNAGIYVLNPAALGHLIHSEKCDMPELFERIRMANLETIAYPMHEPWMDVGKPEDLSHAHNFFNDPR